MTKDTLWWEAAHWEVLAKRASDSINQLTNGSIKYDKANRLYEVVFSDTYPDSVKGSITETASIILITDVDDTRANLRVANKELTKIMHEHVIDLDFFWNLVLTARIRKLRQPK